MQVFVRTLTGTIALEAEPTDTVEHLKSMICSREGISTEHQRLIHEGRPMETGSLAHYNIQNESTIHLTLSLPGG